MDGILLADKETKRISTSNNRSCQMLGYGLEEIQKLGIQDLHQKEYVPYALDLFEKMGRRELTLGQDIPMKRKDGSVFFADINSSLITIKGKEYLMGIFRDVTERKAAEEKAKRHLEQLASLHSIDLAIVSSLDIHVTLDIILRYVTDQLKVDAADILLYKPHLQTLEYASGHGFRTKALQHTR